MVRYSGVGTTVAEDRMQPYPEYVADRCQLSLSEGGW
jgi:hypothetical protein